jgi:Zn-dependent protease with chaperone function
MKYPALLHDPTLGTSRRVTVAWDPTFHGTLRIEDNTGSIRDVAAADCSLASGGWRGGSIHFSWKDDGKAWAVTLDDPAAIARLAKELPPNLAGQIRVWQGQTNRSKVWLSTVLTLATLIGLLPLLILLALFLLRDDIINIIVGKMPASADAQIGNLVHQQLLASGGIVKDGPGLEAVRAVSQRFLPYLPTQDFAFRFEVVNDKSVNAYAAPGGLVVVHTGLLERATSVDQLAGVLAHEMTHVTQRHSVRQIVYNQGLTTTLQWVIGVPDGVAVTLAGAAANLSGLKFSRDQETEADRGGIELLRKARLPASGLPSFLELLAQQQGNLPSFLSTHPADKERSAALQKLIADGGQWETEPVVLDWEAVRRDAAERMKGK